MSSDFSSLHVDPGGRGGFSAKEYMRTAVNGSTPPPGCWPCLLSCIHDSSILTRNASPFPSMSCISVCSSMKAKPMLYILDTPEFREAGGPRCKEGEGSFNLQHVQVLLYTLDTSESGIFDDQPWKRWMLKPWIVSVALSLDSNPGKSSEAWARGLDLWFSMWVISGKSNALQSPLGNLWH